MIILFDKLSLLIIGTDIKIENIIKILKKNFLFSSEMSNTNRKEKVTTVTKFALSAVIKIEQIKSIKKDKM